MAKQRVSRVPLWGRLLLALPLIAIVISIYVMGQHERVGLFEAALLNPTGKSITLPNHLNSTDFTLIDTIQLYDADNLYKKINGHDVAFFRFGFELLTFASYGESVNTFFDLYVYKMDRHANALGIFASERSEDRDPLNLLDAGYRSGGGSFFYRGPWYVQIIPSANNPSTRLGIDVLTDSLLALIPEPQTPLIQLEWFPKDTRIPVSEGYFPDNAFGADFFGDVFTAEYKYGETTITAFRHQSDSAANVFRRYSQFLSEMTTPIASIVIHDQLVERYSAYGEETWVARVGHDIAGLMGVPEGVRADSLFESILAIAITSLTAGSQI